MKNSLLLLLLLLSGCHQQESEIRQSLSLSGEWRFRIDSLDRGVAENWYSDLSDETIRLPGSMAENGKGNEVTVNTDWTGDIVDRSYFTDDKYARYRTAGNIKIPFWLKPDKYYKGVAWYQKEFEIPEGWSGKNIRLMLERPHWETTVFVNGKNAGTGNSLAVPHEFDITGFLKTGKNLISIRVDNRMVIPVGVNSHSVSDHTQGNWNGIAGKILLIATAPVYISDVGIFPDVENRKARVSVRLKNTGGAPFKGDITLVAESASQIKNNALKAIRKKVETSANDSQVIIDYPMGDDFALWDEFLPALYTLNIDLRDERGKLTDRIREDFGMREFRAEGTRFAVNGRQVFLRGTTECCIFPLTGYPPSDTASWMKILRTIKDYGLNHVRFHSYCPPEAAFEAADRLGIYFHVECSSWANQGASIGDGKDIDRFIYREGDMIMREYGNHPSFCMLAYGNEPAGKNQQEFLGRLLTYWKGKDNRRVYTSAAGWPVIPENDYDLTPGPRIQQWGDGLKSIINARPPQTTFDYRDFVSKYNVPVVSHEIGQWCVYPDFTEIEKYKGSLKATNFEIFRESLTGNNMAGQAKDFLIASGKLQSICYKAEIEAALRTPGFAGFQMLQLHDFPGQGTALVGILNPFFESKGYITPEEFRSFCNETVPLARMGKLVYNGTDTIRASVEIAHFGASPIRNAVVSYKIINSSGEILHSGAFNKEEIPAGNCIPAGDISIPLKQVTKAQKLKLEVAIDNTQFRNSWDVWVYPAKEAAVEDVYITVKMDSRAEAVLKKGGKVLYLPYGEIKNGKGAEVAIGFSSIFWNTAWTRNQAPHTLGILCNPDHPVFKNFPTESHSNWQWWDPVTHSQAMVVTDFPAELSPLIQPIDTWFENRKLALAFEVKAGGGKLFVCSVDLVKIDKDRIVSKQLLGSILDYMNSEDFNPTIRVDVNEIKRLIGN